MKKRYVVLTLSGVLLATAPALALFGPMPVIDVGTEHQTWLAQLAQEIQSAQNTAQSAQMEISNITPTRALWGRSIANPMAAEPILEGEVQTLNGALATLQRQTGAAQPPDAGLAFAEAGMSRLPQEQADIANAQAASDDAEGDLSAQQAGHRLAALQLTNAAETRQFLYAQQVQRSADQAKAMVWMTTSNPLAGRF